MGKTIVLIGAGGLMGSICRYLVFLYVTGKISSSFPYATFAVNVAGCFIIGLIYGLAERFQWVTPEWRFFLTTGFCGGFTTFSTFAFENARLLQTSYFMQFALYSFASFVAGLLAVFAGLALAKW